MIPRQVKVFYIHNWKRLKISPTFKYYRMLSFSNKITMIVTPQNKIYSRNFILKIFITLVHHMSKSHNQITSFLFKKLNHLLGCVKITTWNHFLTVNSRENITLIHETKKPNSESNSLCYKIFLVFSEIWSGDIEFQHGTLFKT